MKVILVGSGPETAKLYKTLSDHGHIIEASLGAISPVQLNYFEAKALVAISPECAISQDTLIKASEKGMLIYLVAAASDGLAAWGAASKVPTVAYPLTQTDIDALLGHLRKADSGAANVEDQFRQIHIGGDTAARLNANMATRKVAITGPKGGVGKTEVSVNLGSAFAMSGLSTYIVDADGNGGALAYHMRLAEAKQSMIGLLKREKNNFENAKFQQEAVMAPAASAGTYFNAFTQISTLPTLKILPGLVTDDLADAALKDKAVIDKVISGLYEAGAASNGIVIMDVGINPAHPIHQAALRNAEAIVIVIKPEIPDLAEARRWIKRMITSMTAASVATQGQATEFIAQRVKLCYNMVYGKRFKDAHKFLLEALKNDGLDIPIVPNGILPLVDPELALDAVNSDRIDDIFVWRYKKTHLTELEEFSRAIVDFGSQFVPALPLAAANVGLIKQEKKRSLFGKK
jgi:MinD-like ATPase involved in chromosome partitioning or flagellar assembly